MENWPVVKNKRLATGRPEIDFFKGISRSSEFFTDCSRRFNSAAFMLHKLTVY